jgi:glycine/D-amino acid oxidase-like deaminating enzyme
MDAGLDRHEVIVIGGGQAGLALGYHLAHQGRRFTAGPPELIAAGKVAPAIDRTYPLREVAVAIRYMLEGHARQGRHQRLGVEPF